MSVDLTQLSNALGNLSVKDLLLALKDSQLKNQELQEEIRKLKTTVPDDISHISISDVSSIPESTAHSPIGSTSIKNTTTLFQSKESQAKLNYVSCKMVFFGNIWWETKELSGSNLEYNIAIHKLDSAIAALRVAPRSSQKGLQDHVTLLRIIVKLLEYLPLVYHPLVGATIDGKYYKMFKLMRKKAQEGRSNMIHRFREIGHRIFEDVLPATHFQNGFDRFTDPECRRLLGYDEVTKQYKRLPPCLFAEGKISGATMFRVPAGVKILISLLWGKGTLDKTKITSRRTNAVLWEVTEVNAPCIAFVAIVIRYLLAGDDDFDTQGKRSGIDYDADFKYYVERMEELISDGAKSISDTFQFYNKQIFQLKPTGVSKATGSPVVYDDEEEDLWREMKEIEVRPDDVTDDVTNDCDISTSQPAPSLPVTATTRTETGQVELQPPLQPVSAMKRTGQKGKNSVATTRRTRASQSARRVRFEDEETAAGRITQAESSEPAHSFTTDIISVSERYDEYDEEDREEEEEE